MGEDNWLIEIVILAMLAGFIALRLVSVLGRRTGHEGPANPPLSRAPAKTAGPQGVPADAAAIPALDLPADMPQDIRAALNAIAAADLNFDPAAFTEGAQSAYAMVLEAFWAGKNDDLRDLVSDEIGDQFASAIEAREAEGLRLDNRLVEIERAEIVSANLNGMMAEITVRFDADLVALTRDREGEIVAGSASDAVSTHDLWTFSRHMRSPDPNWLLIATDEER